MPAGAGKAFRAGFTAWPGCPDEIPVTKLLADVYGSSDSKGSGQQAERQRDGEEDELQKSVDCYADDAERQQEQPDEWIGDQSQKCERPAEYEEHAPEQECEHGRRPPSFVLDYCTLRIGRKFPAGSGRAALAGQPGRLSPHRLSGSSDFGYSNCLRKAASCCWTSERSWRRRDTSSSSANRRSAAELVPALADRSVRPTFVCSAASAAGGSPENKCV